MEFLKNKGQSTVEYVLLLGVIVLMVTAALRSDALQNFVGADGEFFNEYSKFISYTYRHGRPGTITGAAQENQYQSIDHDTYSTPNGSPHFAIPANIYPRDQ